MKKIISVFLCIIIAFSVSASAFAQSGKPYVPEIIVTGFGRTDLIIDKGEPTEDQIFLPSMNRLKSALGELVFPLSMFLLFDSSECFAKSLVKTANNLFKEIEFDSNGEPVYDKISLERESDYYTFRYDFRYDVTDTATILNDYIEQIKEYHNVEKVALIPESMGGAVTLAYLYLYGYDSVDTVVFRSSAMMGISFIGKVFTKEIHINPQDVMGFINSFIQGQGNDKILERALVSNIAKFPVMLIANKLNRFFDKEKDYIYENSMCRMFGNLPGLWSFVPSEYYEEAKATMLDKEANRKLIEKIDVYQYEIKPAAAELFSKMQADGVKVALISNYGLHGVPLVENDGCMTDFLVDTKYSSAGAVCSKIGGTLGGNYTQKKDDGFNHISPDGQIDASTCILPMNTWFVKGMVHTWYNDDYYRLIDWIIYESENARIDENPEFPQFLYDNTDDEMLEILTEQSPDPLNDNLTASTFFGAFKNLVPKN